MKNSPDVIALISAVSLHLIILGVMLLNVDFDLPKEKPKEAVIIIEASIVNQKMFDDLAQRKSDKLKEKQRQAALLKKQADDKIKAEKAEVLRKKLEQERIKAEKILAAKVLKEKKEAAKALKQKKAAEKKEKERVKAEKVAKEKAAKEKTIEDARIKAEQEVKRKVEEAAAEAERVRQAELDKQMEAEFSDDFSSAKDAKQLAEIDKYMRFIRDKINKNWLVDPTMKGSSCVLAIKLAPDGLVISVDITSGKVSVCKSAIAATFKAKTLPIPKDPEIAIEFRDFDFTLKPDV